METGEHKLENTVPYRMNIPVDVKQWLEALAKKNLRSQSAEIILALREKMEREGATNADAQ